MDIGGTFTDFSLLDLASGQFTIHKLLTNTLEPDKTLIERATELLAKSGVYFNPDPCLTPTSVGPASTAQ